MKRVLVIFFFGLYAYESTAQTWMLSRFENCPNETLYIDDHYYGADSLDKGITRVDYLFSIRVDTVQNTVLEQMSTLEIGYKTSRFCQTAYLYMDSLHKEGADVMSLITARNRIAYPQSVFEMYWQNYPARGKLTCSGRVFNTDFLYEEDLPDMKWTITGEIDTMLGYSTQKAVCRFRGRDYVAWFTPELPVSAGPWKFSGLPGLILKVGDSRGDYVFTAKGVYSISSAIEMPKYLYIKTTRQKYQQAVKSNMTDFVQASRLYLKGMEIRVSESMPKRELEYDFMELE